MEFEVNNKKIIKIYNIYIWLILFFIGLTFEMNVIENKYIIVLLSSMFLFLIILMICDKTFSIKDHIKFDIRDILLLVAMAIWRRNLYVYGVCDPKFSLKYLIITVIMYMYGKCHIIYMNKKTERNTFYETNIIFPLGLGLMIFNIASIISWYICPHREVIDPLLEGRYWISIINPIKGDYPATFYAFHPIIFISLVFWGILTFKNNPLKSSIVIFGGTFTPIWFGIAPRTRSPLVVFILSFFAGVVLYYIQKLIKSNAKKYYKTICFIIINIVFFIVLILLSIKYIDSIKELYNSSFFSRDGGIFNNIRFIWAKEAIIGLPRYPFGGNKEIGYTTSHIVWTSFASQGGIIPFILIIIWNILMIKDIVMLSISKKNNIPRILFLILPYVGVFLYSCTEDLIYFMFEMSVITLVAGMIRGEVESEQNYIKK